MMKRSPSRALPTLLVGVLLVLAILAPSRRAGARSARAPNARSVATCDDLILQGTEDSTLTLAPSCGVTQPVQFVGNIAGCSLALGYPYDTSGQLDVYQWDPLTLAPDPTTVALRSYSYTASALTYNHVRQDFSLPIVTRSLSNVAEPPTGDIALDFHTSSGVWNYLNVSYAGSAPASLPVALQYAPGIPRHGLKGAHPVVGHSVCVGDAALQSLYVVQSVMTTSALVDTTPYEMVQRFRVPAQVELHWVETAFGVVSPRYPVVAGEIAIIDAQGASTPPATLPDPDVQAPFGGYPTDRPVWSSHYDFDHLITLDSNHDYWLLVRTAHDYGVFARTLTGTESPEFNANIGPIFTRTAPSGGWSSVPGKALDFRLIGSPFGVIDVPRSVPAPSSLRLHVTPNPSKGAAFVIFSGASGAVRFDVLDARGRRVGGGSALAGAEGRWMWRGVRDDGRLLPAGMYFVRATDRAGRVAVERLAVIR